MAILKTSTPISELRKLYGNVAIFRLVKGKLIMSARYDKSKIKWTDTQKEERKKFAEYIKMTKAILSDPIKLAEYRAKCKPGESAYRILRAELMRGESPSPGSNAKCKM